MYILEVAHGCPSTNYPSNGIFQMDQALALKRLGHKVIYLALDLRSIRHKRTFGIVKMHDPLEIIELNIPVGRVPRVCRDFVYKISFAYVLRRIIKEYSIPEVIHVHFGELAFCIADTCKRLRIPYILTEHSSSLNSSLIPKNTLRKEKYSIDNSERVIAVSNALKKRMMAYSSKNIEVIPNIVDFSTFDTRKKEHTGIVVLSAANLNYGKGLDVLIHAFCRCITTGMQSMTLVIMGEGPEHYRLQSMAKEFNIEDRVMFFGVYNRKDFAEELSKADIFVLPSRGETFGVVYAEAIASGTPVIATKCGGPEDFINEANGMLVEIDDINAVSDAIAYISKNIDKYDSHKVRDSIVRKLNSNSVGVAIETVMRDVVNY